MPLSRLSFFTPCLSVSRVNHWHETLQAVVDNGTRIHHLFVDALACATGNSIGKSAALTASSVWCRVPIPLPDERQCRRVCT